MFVKSFVNINPCFIILFISSNYLFYLPDFEINNKQKTCFSSKLKKIWSKRIDTCGFKVQMCTIFTRLDFLKFVGSDSGHSVIIFYPPAY